jgi:carbonic anhydrase
LYILEVIGGPVKEEHKFLQFHMHWGPDTSVGSEHLVDGKSYAAEVIHYLFRLALNDYDKFFSLKILKLHFVNWNAQRYKSGGDAAKSMNHDGLTVLGVFVQVTQLIFV